MTSKLARKQKQLEKLWRKVRTQRLKDPHAVYAKIDRLEAEIRYLQDGKEGRVSAHKARHV